MDKLSGLDDIERKGGAPYNMKRERQNTENEAELQSAAFTWSPP